MTIIGLVCLLMLAPAETTDDSGAQIAELKKKVQLFEKWQKAADARRKAAIEKYKAELATYQAAKAAHDKLPAPRSEAASAKLREVTNKFVKAAIAALADASPKMVDEILGHLAVTVSNGQASIPLIEALKSGILSGNESPAEIGELLYLAGEKLEFARMLARPENRGALRALLQELRDRYKQPVNPDDAPTYDFRKVFEALRDLNGEAYKETARKSAASLGVHDPEGRLVHERLSVVYLTDRGVASPVLEGFKEAFSGWMRAASPDRAIKERSYEGWSPQNVRELMTDAAAILSAGSSAVVLPGCPPNESSVALQRQQVLCAPAYGGIIAVQIRTGPDGMSEAVASWRTREEGKQLNKADDVASEPFTLRPAKSNEAKSEEEGRLKGDSFAVKVMGTGTVYKRIKKLFEQLAALQRAQQQQAERGEGETDGTRKDKALDQKDPSGIGSGGARDKVPGIVEATPRADQPDGRWWHAFFFAATPYLEDSTATWRSKTAFSAVDLLALGTGVALLSRSIEARNGPSGGDAAAIDDANTLRTASGATFGGLLVFRALTAGCYAWQRCRALTTW